MVDWCIVLVEMPLTQFEEGWPLPTESLPELPYTLTLVNLTLTLTLWPIISGVLTSLFLPDPLIILHRLPAFLESLMPLKNWCSIHARWCKSSLKHSIRFCGIFPSLKHNFFAYRSSKVSDCIFGMEAYKIINLKNKNKLKLIRKLMSYVFKRFIKTPVVCVYN